jgi:hypothetical protein
MSRYDTDVKKSNKLLFVLTTAIAITVIAIIVLAANTPAAHASNWDRMPWNQADEKFAFSEATVQPYLGLQKSGSLSPLQKTLPAENWGNHSPHPDWNKRLAHNQYKVCGLSLC